MKKKKKNEKTKKINNLVINFWERFLIVWIISRSSVKMEWVKWMKSLNDLLNVFYRTQKQVIWSVSYHFVYRVLYKLVCILTLLCYRSKLSSYKVLFVLYLSVLCDLV